MSHREWAQEAFEKLNAGETVTVRPRGYSMSGRIDDGDLVTLAPCPTRELQVGDIVLARIQGRRHSLFVLHQILEIRFWYYLIGNEAGRHDGWVNGESIFGKVTGVQTSSPLPIKEFSSEKEEAEFQRLSLLLEWKTLEEVVVWCDSIIAAQGTPDVYIVEASSQSNEGVFAVSEALKKVAGEADAASLRRRLFAEMHSRVVADRFNAFEVGRWLWDIVNERIEFQPTDEPEMWRFHAELEMAECSREGPDEKIDEMIEFLKFQSKKC